VPSEALVLTCCLPARWEHTPEWSYTSKLLISKHQQVQLLEAASVLVAMNGNPPRRPTAAAVPAASASVPTTTTTPPDLGRHFSSDRDSSSPPASGYSEQQDRSSADTTPPPHLDDISAPHGSYTSSFGWRNGYGPGAGLSQSYQPGVYGSSVAESVTSVSGFGHLGHFRQPSQDQRPTSSGRNATGKDDRELAAAVEALSCSYNSNTGSRRGPFPTDVPPVPPLPQYLGDDVLSGTSFIGSYPSRAPESFERGAGRRYDIDTKMAEDSDDDDVRSRARSDEDDDGVFGKMEE